MTWLVDVILALRKLKGSAQMRDICSVVKKSRGVSPTNSHHDETIRSTIYRHSSDSPTYLNTNPDLFERLRGDGYGVWGLREVEDPESVTHAEWDMKLLALAELTAEELQNCRESDESVHQLLDKKTVEMKRKMFGGRNAI